MDVVGQEDRASVACFVAGALFALTDVKGVRIVSGLWDADEEPRWLERETY